MSVPLSIAQRATLACILEATAAKPGNVHRGADFEDVGYPDFLLSAVAIGPAIESAFARGVGSAALDAVCATQAMVGGNTNLGMILLFAPLAAAAQSLSQTTPTHNDASPQERSLLLERLKASLARTLRSLTADDSAKIYQAIRLAKPGGIGRVDQHDIQDEAPSDLLAAMRAAADRDLIARQYANGFVEVFQAAVAIGECLETGHSLSAAIVRVHLQLMAAHPDSLIARKCGPATASEAATRAQRVLAAGPIGGDDYWQAIGDFDFWLRADGHRRNPGTTADLVAAGLFIGLLCDSVRPPLDWRDRS